MRHDPQLHGAGRAEAQRYKLFELHRQEARQTHSGRRYGPIEDIHATTAEILRARAIRSLDPTGRRGAAKD